MFGMIIKISNVTNAPRYRILGWHLTPTLGGAPARYVLFPGAYFSITSASVISFVLLAKQ
jgi:hypothetical protein